MKRTKRFLSVVESVPGLRRTRYKAYIPRTNQKQRRFYPETGTGLLPEKLTADWCGHFYRCKLSKDKSGRIFYRFNVTADYEPTPVVDIESELLEIQNETGER